MSRRIVHAVLFSLFGSFAIQCAHNMLLAQDADYIHKASGSAIFVYAPNTQPCAERQVGSNLLPSGSGFVIGIRQKGATAENWRGYKFLITAKHVIGNRTSIILRLNRKDTPEFTCYPLQLVRNRDKRNILTPDRPEVDLIAVSIPNIPNTDPTVFEYSMVLDEQQMAKLEVQVGTNVFAVGYLYGYAGKKKNFPVTKFGKVALLTDESWYPGSVEQKLLEQAYIIEMENTMGMSGAPVMLQSPQFTIGPGGKFQFRRMPPYILGVIKGLMISPLGPQAITSSGVAAIEPAFNLREFIKKIADELSSTTGDVQLEPTKQGLRPPLPGPPAADEFPRVKKTGQADQTYFG